MNDETRHYDDERLLAFALGSEDDPELEAALAGDAQLQERVTAMRADVETVAAALDRVVPAPSDDYTDLSDPRWGELRQFVTSPAPATPRRRPTWSRVLAPAAALALVLVAGVVGVQQMGTGGDETASLAEEGKAVKSNDREGGTLSGAPAADGSQGIDEGTGFGAVWDAVPDRDSYEIVVIGRALAPTGERQLFEVLRELRGETEDYVSLRVIGRALAPETRAVLYLRPVIGAPSASPTPTPQTSSTGADASAGVFAYRFRGAPALAQPLPVGADVESIALP